MQFKRAAVAAAEQAAALERRQSLAASEAAQQLAARPGQPLPENLSQSDALARLRAEQEKLVEEFETQRIEAEASKPQRMS